MLKQKMKKTFALLVSICMIFQMLSYNAYASPEMIATTYYVGGENASDDNNGTSSVTPLATLSAAVTKINGLDAGSYTIYVQGGTIEQNPIIIGDDIKALQVAIIGTATGSAITYAATGSSIIMRGDTNSDSMISVSNNATLTLGDAGGVNPGMLFLDGGSRPEEIETSAMISVEYGGTLKMYSDTTLQNNFTDSSGGAIYNMGTFHMYGGLISHNSADMGGGVYNRGSFFLTAGTISYNEAKYSGAGVYNRLDFMMNGGTISNNASLEQGGGVNNLSKFTMNGGAIESNTASIGGAILNSSNMYFSGLLSIPGGSNNDNDIVTSKPINIIGKVVAKDNNKILIGALSNIAGSLILSGSSSLVEMSYTAFVCDDSNYTITFAGTLSFIGSAPTYYIGGTGAADTNNGTSPSTPFATINKALTTSFAGKCTIIIQSDLVLTSAIEIIGDVTLMSDGTKRTITLDGSYTDYRIIDIPIGTLNLGNPSNSETTDTLIFDCTNTNSYLDSVIENRDKLNMYSGVVFKNSKDLVIYNMKTLNLLGGRIENNDAACMIENMGTMIVAGTDIINNTTDYVIENRGTLTITAGDILNNTGIGLSNYGTFTMSGGNLISKELIGVSNNATMKLSGTTVISGGTTNPSGIYLNNVANTIVLDGDISQGTTYLVDMENYFEGRPILTGTPTLVGNNASKFVLAKHSDIFKIGADGCLAYIDTTNKGTTYYVGGTTANDSNVGTSATEALATLNAAVSKIGAGKGTIVLQSDIILDTSLYITGSITLVSDDTPRVITRGADCKLEGEIYTRAMIYVTGKLVLGNVSNTGNDITPTLILDGGYDQEILAGSSIIENRGTLSLYSGVSLQNNVGDIESGGVHNRGIFHMYGGLIKNNVGYNVGGVNDDYNAIFIMDKGSISNNTGEVGGVLLDTNSSFTMNGGSISNNIGSDKTYNFGTGGVLFYNNAEFIMNGGNITGNTGRVGGVSVSGKNNLNSKAMLTSNLPCIFDMNGGTINNNKGFMPGVAVVGTTSEFRLSGNASITDGDIVAFIAGDNNKGIILEGARSSELSTITVGVYERLTVNYAKDSMIHSLKASNSEYVLAYPIGTRLISSSPNYAYSIGDLEKFAVNGEDYAINGEGYLATKLLREWVTISDDTVYYDEGNVRTVNVVVKKGSTVLMENEDYVLHYSNNFSVGTANVAVVGMGTYGGVINKSFTIREAKALPTIQTGTLLIPIDLTGAKLPKNTENFTIPVPTDNLLQQIRQEGITKVHVAVSIPDSDLDSGQKIDLILEKEVIEAAKLENKNLAVSVTDSKGRERYRWEFNEADLSTTLNQITDVNLSLKVENIAGHTQLKETLGENAQGLVISFGHDGVLPTQATVSIYVGDLEGIVLGQKIYLYHLNPETGKLETLPFSNGYVVDAQGYITMEILHCSDYVILPKAAKLSLVTSLRDQISVEPSATTLSIGHTATINVKLPSTLELLASSSDKTSQTAIGGVTVTYRSTNKKVATIDKEGVITAVAAGKVTIATTISLYSGKVKTFKTTVAVKEAKLTFKASTETLKVGESFTFKAEIAGLKEAEIVWSTTKKSIVVIDKKTGIATAKAPGTDYVVATVGNEIRKIKVVVK